DTHKYGKNHSKENRRDGDKCPPPATPHISPCQLEVHYFIFFIFSVVKKSSLIDWLKVALLYVIIVSCPFFSAGIISILQGIILPPISLTSEHCKISTSLLSSSKNSNLSSR